MDFAAALSFLLFSALSLLLFSTLSLLSLESPVRVESTTFFSRPSRLNTLQSRVSAECQRGVGVQTDLYLTAPSS